MKNLTAIFLTIFLSVNLFSQTNMIIRKTDTSIISIPISEIDSVYFEEEGNVFTCGDLITDIDGNTYNTIQIGNQCWMSDNLKATHYSNGISIPLVTDTTGWAELNNTDDAYCYYNNNANGEADIYGALYTWVAAMGDNAISSNSNPSGVQGVCPVGWHLPSNLEWSELTDYVGGEDVAGGKMKEVGYEHWSEPNTAADNSFGFTALPNGIRYSFNGDYVQLTTYSYWWSATESMSASAWYCHLSYAYEQSDIFDYAKSSGIAVRCVKD